MRERECYRDGLLHSPSVGILWVFFQALQLARKKSSPAKLPPGPVPLPIIGSLFKLGNKPNESLAELAKTYGPLMTLRLGRVTTIVASSSTMAKEILQRHDHVLAGRTVVHSVCTLGYNDSSIGFSQPNQHRRRLRSICNTQIFTTQKLDSLEYLRHRKVHELLDHMREKSQTGQPVEIGEAAFVTSLNLISNTVFSVDMVGLDSKSAQEFSSLVWGFMEEIGGTNVVDYFTFLSPFDPQGRRFRMTAHLKRLFSIFDEMIDERKQDGRSGSDDSGTRNDFLNTLLDHIHSGGLTRHHVKCLLVVQVTRSKIMGQARAVLVEIRISINEASSCRSYRVILRRSSPLTQFYQFLRRKFHLPPPGSSLEIRSEAPRDVTIITSPSVRGVL